MDVLVIDDAAPIRSRLRELFVEIPGIGVISEASGVAEARQLLGQEPDLIILDLRLGAESGLTLLQELKQQRSRVRVMVLTNETSERHRRTCAELGADYFFDKSTDYDSVLLALAKEVERVKARVDAST